MIHLIPYTYLNKNIKKILFYIKENALLSWINIFITYIFTIIY